MQTEHPDDANNFRSYWANGHGCYSNARTERISPLAGRISHTHFQRIWLPLDRVLLLWANPKDRLAGGQLHMRGNQNRDPSITHTYLKDTRYQRHRALLDLFLDRSLTLSLQFCLMHKRNAHEIRHNRSTDSNGRMQIRKSRTFPRNMENRTFKPKSPPLSSVKLTNCSTAGAYFVIAKSSVCDSTPQQPSRCVRCAGIPLHAQSPISLSLVSDLKCACASYRLLPLQY